MRLSLLQMTSGIDPAANAATLTGAVEAARDAGSDMLLTPEMSGLLDRDRTRAAGHIVAEDEDRVLAAVRDAAARAGIWVALGSLAVRAEGDGRYANRSFLIDGTGAIRARYDKIHLFDVDLPTGESWRESAAYRPGAGPVMAQTPWGRIGLSICYDLRFPALYAAYAQAGCDLVLVPAAFTVPTGRAHWHVLLRARAIESGCFIAATAQSGTHEDGRETFGHSLVVGPWGDVLLDMETGAGIAHVTLDRAEIGRVKARIPAVAHRRPIAEVKLS